MTRVRPVAILAAVALVASALAASALAGCGDDAATATTSGPPLGHGGPNGAQNLGAPPDAGVDAGPSTPVTLNFRDEDFVESPQNRDPFRSYARLFKVRPPEAAQRTVIMPTTGLDEMTLIAIITGTADARAMFTDPATIGYIVERGDYIGRPEVVQTGGDQGMAVTLNWRVDRIRPDSVVLVRDDPTAPGNPPLTRVIPLHDANETPNIAASGQGVRVVTPPGGNADGHGTLPSDFLGDMRRQAATGNGAVYLAPTSGN